jgi:hypothetical protein
MFSSEGYGRIVTDDNDDSFETDDLTDKLIDTTGPVSFTSGSSGKKHIYRDHYLSPEVSELVNELRKIDVPFALREGDIVFQVPDSQEHLIVDINEFIPIVFDTWYPIHASKSATVMLKEQLEDANLFKEFVDECTLEFVGKSNVRTLVFWKFISDKRLRKYLVSIGVKASIEVERRVDIDFVLPD